MDLSDASELSSEIFCYGYVCNLDVLDLQFLVHVLNEMGCACFNQTGGLSIQSIIVLIFLYGWLILMMNSLSVRFQFQSIWMP